MKDSMITRVLRISPAQSELYRRNKSRIFIAVEGESTIDTILAQPLRPVEDYIDTAHRAIAQAGLNEDYGDLRANYGSQMSIAGSSFLTTSSWLKDESGNVFDLIISLDSDYESMDAFRPNIIGTTEIQDANGENPLILSCDIEDLIPSDSSVDTSEDTSGDYDELRGSADMGQPTNQSQPQMQQDRQPPAGANNGGSGNGNHSEMSANDAEIAARRSTDTGGDVPGGRGNSDRQPGGQGRVISEDDGRLKANRDEGVHIDGSTTPSNDGAVVSGQGRVQNPNDGRLKANIDAGVTVDNPEGDASRAPESEKTEDKAPAMARKARQQSTDTPKRGQVKNPRFDRRLKGNR